jgi:hypothetical protein
MWFALLLTPTIILAATSPADATELPAGVSGEEWSSIQQQIEAERYRITESDRPGTLFRADNPTQRFTAHFGAEDLVITPRGRAEPAWKLGLRLTAWGTPTDLEQVEFAYATAENNRIQYRRGPLTEWYVNTTMGLEQGFTIEAPPVDDIAELVLEMALDGDLSAELAANGNAVTFRDESSSTTLSYSGLAAWDAVGAPLEARMKLAGGATRLHLVVSVNGAAWPITVDPIFTQVAKLLPTPEPDSGGANFGFSVAVDDDLMVVGLLDVERGFRAGAAHVFQRDQGGSGAWGHVAKISALDGAPHHEFGISVAIDANTSVIGAPPSDSLGLDSGAAYVYFISDAFFADNFETGDTSGWSVTVP